MPHWGVERHCGRNPRASPGFAWFALGCTLTGPFGPPDRRQRHGVVIFIFHVCDMCHMIDRFLFSGTGDYGESFRNHSSSFFIAPTRTRSTAGLVRETMPVS